MIHLNFQKREYLFLLEIVLILISRTYCAFQIIEAFRLRVSLYNINLFMCCINVKDVILLDILVLNPSK